MKYIVNEVDATVCPISVEALRYLTVKMDMTVFDTEEEAVKEAKNILVKQLDDLVEEYKAQEELAKQFYKKCESIRVRIGYLDNIIDGY
jgi:hypothetical protein